MRYFTKIHAASQLVGPVLTLQEFAQERLKRTMVKFAGLFAPAVVFCPNSVAVLTKMSLAISQEGVSIVRRTTQILMILM